MTGSSWQTAQQALVDRAFVVPPRDTDEDLLRREIIAERLRFIRKMISTGLGDDLIAMVLANYDAKAVEEMRGGHPIHRVESYSAALQRLRPAVIREARRLAAEERSS